MKKKKKDQKNYTQYTIPRQIARPPGGLERGLTDAANCHLRTAVFFSLGKSLLLPTVQCSLGTSDGSFSWRLVRGETPTHCQPSSGGVWAVFRNEMFIWWVLAVRWWQQRSEWTQTDDEENVNAHNDGEKAQEKVLLKIFFYEGEPECQEALIYTHTHTPACIHTAGRIHTRAHTHTHTHT